MQLASNTFALILVAMISSANASGFKNPCVKLRSGRNCQGDVSDCVADNNSLQELMDCVQISPSYDRYPNGEWLDWEMCSSGGDYTKYDHDNTFDGPKRGCIVPRDVIIDRSMSSCGYTSTPGLLLTCPIHEPTFLDCLCNYHIQALHLLNLAKCFGTGTFPQLPCVHARRDLSLRPPPKIMASLNKRKLTEMISDAGVEFYIDEYERPVYTDGTIGYPLPYWQKLILDGDGIMRCYIMPFSTNEYCIGWLLPEPKESLDGPTGRWVNATSGKDKADFSESASIATTQTVSPIAATSFPPSATVPLPTVIPSTAKQEPTAKPTATRTNNTAGATAPVAVYLLLAFGIQVFAIMYQKMS